MLETIAVLGAAAAAVGVLTLPLAWLARRENALAQADERRPLTAEELAALWVDEGGESGGA